MKKEPRFEIVRSHAGWFARFVAANGRKVWQTEIYQRKQKAVTAVSLVVGRRVVLHHDALEIPHRAGNYGLLEVREVDERTFPPLGDAL